MRSTRTAAGRFTLGALLCALAPGASPGEVTPATAPLSVATESGLVQGVVHEGRARAWLGIPYAAPPVGEKRWRPPAPPARWPQTRRTDAAGPACAQPPAAGASEPFAGSEDCLTLNVYSPLAPRAERLPVMVWVHGGANIWGRGSDLDGSRLASRHDVVVVTFNYRLGLFGWFHHPAITQTQADGPKTGQLAILDMIAALRWVERNVAAFGGDPRNVTIFGESAGAQNVYALLLTPAAAGLFHKAIAQSGGFWNMTKAQAVHDRDAPEPGTPASAREVVGELLVAGGAAANRAEARRVQDTWPAEKLRHWLVQRSTAEVVARLRDRLRVDYDMPSVVYDGALVSAVPHRERLARGDYNAVPMIVGGNRDEQKLYMHADPAFVRQAGGRTEIRDADHYAAVSRFYSDWWNFMAVDDLAPRLARPAWAYRFDWDDAPTAPTDLRALFGAAHGLDVPFVSGDFDDEGFSALFNEENRAGRERLSAAMMSYWSAFARSGDPGRGAKGELPEWRPWAAGREKLVLDARGPRMAPLAVDGGRLLEELFASPHLSHAEKCAIYRDDTMFPRYPLEDLAARGCRRDE